MCVCSCVCVCVCLLVVVFLNEGHVCVFAGGGVPTRRACVCVCVCVCLLLVVFLSEGHISLRSPVWLSVEGVSGSLNSMGRCLGSSCLGCVSMVTCDCDCCWG